jgi:DNA-binding SARP family transcriptional activator
VTVVGPAIRELRIMLLGPFSVADDRGARPGPLAHKAQDLLALMLISRERRVLRETAAEALWPGAPGDVSRKAMRQALWHIHRITDDGVDDPNRLVVSDGDGLHINPERPLWVDLPVFADAAHVAQSRAVEPTDLGALATAADLYRGPLHAGCYDEWCLIPRARLEDRCLTLLDALSREHERHGDLISAIAWAQRLLDIEPAHERSHRRLMRLYSRTGDRTRALRQLSQCRWILQHELGVQPDARTEELGTAISMDRVPSPAQGEEPAAGPPASVVAGLREELAALQQSIDAIGERLQHQGPVHDSGR